jgi:sucrose phosphorylase
MFLTKDAVFPNGASDADLQALYRPRPGTPFTDVTLANGERRVLWTTFSANQVDINVRHPAGAAYLESILRTFAEGGIRMVRLDAVGYVVKKAGTSCFMIPETFDFIMEFAGKAGALGMETLVEVHSHYRKQIEVAVHSDWVYDFALPPLLLHAMAFRSSVYLKQWITIRPTNAINVLDTHDGIGIMDIGPERSDPVAHPGLVPANQLDELIEVIHSKSRGESRLATGVAASNLDIYQVNCTFYDALGRDDQRYLLARAVQMFLPGIPQVYYVGLLAGTNDLALLARTGVGRDINRRYYSQEALLLALQQPVVSRLLDLIRLRNSHPAFSGSFESLECGDAELDLRWRHGTAVVRLRADVAAGSCELTYTQDGRTEFFAFDTADPGSRSPAVQP